MCQLIQLSSERGTMFDWRLLRRTKYEKERPRTWRGLSGCGQGDFSVIHNLAQPLDGNIERPEGSVSAEKLEDRYEAFLILPPPRRIFPGLRLGCDTVDDLFEIAFGTPHTRQMPMFPVTTIFTTLRAELDESVAGELLILPHVVLRRVVIATHMLNGEVWRVDDIVAHVPEHLLEEFTLKLVTCELSPERKHLLVMNRIWKWEMARTHLESTIFHLEPGKSTNCTEKLIHLFAGQTFDFDGVRTLLRGHPRTN